MKGRLMMKVVDKKFRVEVAGSKGGRIIRWRNHEMAFSSRVVAGEKYRLEQRHRRFRNEATSWKNLHKNGVRCFYVTVVNLA